MIAHYRLKGVTYFVANDSHFILRVIDGDGNVFVHDGMCNSGVQMNVSDAINVETLEGALGSVQGWTHLDGNDDEVCATLCVLLLRLPPGLLTLFELPVTEVAVQRPILASSYSTDTGSTYMRLTLRWCL